MSDSDDICDPKRRLKCPRNVRQSLLDIIRVFITDMIVATMDDGEVIKKRANWRFSRNVFFPMTYNYARSGPVTDSGKVSKQGQDQLGRMRAYGMRTTLIRYAHHTQP